MVQSLSHKVAVVTGASRGAGRAIASVLGQAGATVYVTGRTVRGAAAVDGLPGTIDETADEVTARGGRGIAVRCDHTVDAEIEAFAERVRVEAGRVDILVNNVWGGYEGYTMGIPMVPFWEQPRSQWESMFVAGVRPHLVTSQLLAPLMIGNVSGELSPEPSLQETGSKLIVSTVAWAYDEYLRNLF
jgi:NAD(P)-dependent dehydrogenase (short-subunit alcohol dehydrogenase family)